MHGIYNIGNFFINADRNTTVICSDPESSCLIRIKAVDIFDRLVFIHPSKAASIVAVQSAISSDPQDTVLCLGNIIRLATRQPVSIVIYRLDICVITLFCCRLHVTARLPCSKQNKDSCKDSRLHMIRTYLRILCLLLSLSPVMKQLQHDKKRHQRHNLIQKVHVKLSNHITEPMDQSHLSKQIDHTISPDIPGSAIGEKDI